MAIHPRLIHRIRRGILAKLININISSDRKDGSAISEAKKRTKAEACRLIEEALEEQYRAAKEDDAYVESFFQGHLLNNALGLKEEDIGEEDLG